MEIRPQVNRVKKKKKEKGGCLKICNYLINVNAVLIIVKLFSCVRIKLRISTIKTDYELLFLQALKCSTTKHELHKTFLSQ